VSAADIPPPSIQLRFGTALYDGVRGSYCWTPPVQPGEPPLPGLCADVLPPVFDTVLAWPTGEPLEFVINGPEPTALTLWVYSKPSDPLLLQSELPVGTSVDWQPTVAPGAYVLSVAARWPQGDVIYYFPVGILAGGAPSGTRPAEPDFAPGDGVVGPAVPVPAPTALAPATPTLPAPGEPAGQVLLRDDFTELSSGFPLESREPAARRVGYANGAYVVARLAGSGGAAFVAYPEPFADFQAEIDARLMPPPDNGYVFLDFRRQENGDYYSFLVDPNAGKLLLLRHTDGGDARIIDWTAASAIQPGTATNRLGVRARGSAITLLIDGTEVGRAQDDALRTGWLGFGVDSLADERAEGRFSHLLVIAIE
jgi:hypothetical protein